ncbi:hypothetical protein [Streptomyces tsukubensis]|uniref:Uncharacterized protein n=1 Tax=Streptomyces tsukubensis TaxID=83656 RepID=A0A1V4A7H8_9ACTN|nr:hypothetical protein [Streptomyces tsukubensis]OON78031.1 hypothetical protein B1H18_17575 [Streptomyces tsukubensis]QFR97195.1 hypothetical protein GBW32_34230 [Streptomyces tsukubensis]
MPDQQAHPGDDPLDVDAGPVAPGSRADDEDSEDREANGEPDSDASDRDGSGPLRTRGVDEGPTDEPVPDEPTG